MDHCAMQSKDLKLCGRLRDVGNRFQLVSDLLATVPTLQPRPRKLRPDRARTKVLLQSVERAVTAAEMVQLQARQLQLQPAGSPQWEQARDRHHPGAGRIGGTPATAAGGTIGCRPAGLAPNGRRLRRKLYVRSSL